MATPLDYLKSDLAKVDARLEELDQALELGLITQAEHQAGLKAINDFREKSKQAFTRRLSE